MPSQYEKRKAKTPEKVVEEIQERRSEIRAQGEPTYTQSGLDIYSPDGGKTYEIAEISYNPETKDAKVTTIYSISRLVALTGLNQKTALNTLKRKLIVKE